MEEKRIYSYHTFLFPFLRKKSLICQKYLAKMYKRQATETTIRDTADLKAAQISPRETEFSEKKHDPK